MIKRYLNQNMSILPNCYLSLHTSILVMAKFMCMLVLLTRVFLATSVGLYQDFVMITDFSNQVLNNSWKISQSSSRSLLDCSTLCKRCCGCFGFNTFTKICRVFRGCYNADVTGHEKGWIYHSLKELHEKDKPENCQDVFERGHTTSGIYTIYLWNECAKMFGSVDVFCDMETSDGGWTVVQRRISGSTNFNRSWSDYKTGFGNLNENLWIGNEVIHQLTRNEHVTLYVAITLDNGTTLYQEYRHFSVADESDKFRLFLQGPTNGSLGDSMVNVGGQGNIHGMPFSTYDQHNAFNEYCGRQYNGGWWFNGCSYCYLNGPWKDSLWPWNPVVVYMADVGRTYMMIRPN